MPTANEQYQNAKVANNTSFSAEWARTQQALAKMSAGDRAAQLGFSSLQPGEYVMAYDALGQARMRIGHQTDGTVAVVYGNGKPPPVPTAPIVSARQLAVFVYWDGTFTGGYARPGDLGRVDVHMDDDPAFIPDGTTIVGSLPQEGGLIVVADNETHYIKTVAVSTSDVASAPTDGIAVLPLPAGQIAAGAIGAQQLAVDIALISRLIVGNPSASRLELEGRTGAIPGMHLYDDTGNETFRLDATTGNVAMKGSIRTADSGQRLVIRETPTDNDMRFYPATGSLYARLYSTTVTHGSVDYGSMLIASPTYNGRESYMWVTPSDIELYRGTNSGVDSFAVLFINDAAATLSFRNVASGPTLGNLQLDATGFDLSQSNTAGSLLGRVYSYNAGTSVAYGSQSLDVDATGLYYTGTGNYIELNTGGNLWKFNSTVFGNYTLNSAFLFATSGFDIYNPVSGAPLAIGCSTVVYKTSARETKTDITDLDFDPVEATRTARAQTWRRKVDMHDEHGKPKQARKFVGPMANDVPSILQVYSGPNNDQLGIDLVSQVGVVWAAIPDLADRLDALETRLTALEPA